MATDLSSPQPASNASGADRTTNSSAPAEHKGHAPSDQVILSKEQLAEFIKEIESNYINYAKIGGDDPLWNDVSSKLLRRHTLLLTALSIFKDFKYTYRQALSLAATDVFVEKAQHMLTVRATLFKRFGVAACLLFLLVVACGAGYIIWNRPGENESFDANKLTMKIIQGASFASMIILAGAFFFFLARSFFHEMLVAYRSRHALRLGRLYVYMKGGPVKLKELIQAFQWNHEFRSAFKDIKPDTLIQSDIQRITSLPPEALKGLAEVIKSCKGEGAAKSKKKRNGEQT